MGSTWAENLGAMMLSKKNLRVRIVIFLGLLFSCELYSADRFAAHKSKSQREFAVEISRLKGKSGKEAELAELTAARDHFFPPVGGAASAEDLALVKVVRDAGIKSAEDATSLVLAAKTGGGGGVGIDTVLAMAKAQAQSLLAECEKTKLMIESLGGKVEEAARMEVLANIALLIRDIDNAIKKNFDIDSLSNIADKVEQINKILSLAITSHGSVLGKIAALQTGLGSGGGSADLQRQLDELKKKNEALQKARTSDLSGEQYLLLLASKILDSSIDRSFKEEADIDFFLQRLAREGLKQAENFTELLGQMREIFAFREAAAEDLRKEFDIESLATEAEKMLKNAAAYTAVFSPFDKKIKQEDLLGCMRNVIERMDYFLYVKYSIGGGSLDFFEISNKLSDFTELKDKAPWIGLALGMKTKRSHSESSLFFGDNVKELAEATKKSGTQEYNPLFAMMRKLISFKSLASFEVKDIQFESYKKVLKEMESQSSPTYISVYKEGWLLTTKIKTVKGEIEDLKRQIDSSFQNVLSIIESPTPEGLEESKAKLNELKDAYSLKLSELNSILDNYASLQNTLSTASIRDLMYSCYQDFTTDFDLSSLDFNDKMVLDVFTNYFIAFNTPIDVKDSITPIFQATRSWALLVLVRDLCQRFLSDCSISKSVDAVSIDDFKLAFASKSVTAEEVIKSLLLNFQKTLFFNEKFFFRPKDICRFSSRLFSLHTYDSDESIAQFLLSLSGENSSEYPKNKVNGKGFEESCRTVARVLFEFLEKIKIAGRKDFNRTEWIEKIKTASNNNEIKKLLDLLAQQDLWDESAWDEINSLRNACDVSFKEGKIPTLFGTVSAQSPLSKYAQEVKKQELAKITAALKKEKEQKFRQALMSFNETLKRDVQEFCTEFKPSSGDMKPEQTFLTELLNRFGVKAVYDFFKINEAFIPLLLEKPKNFDKSGLLNRALDLESKCFNIQKKGALFNSLAILQFGPLMNPAAENSDAKSLSAIRSSEQALQDLLYILRDTHQYEELIGLAMRFYGHVYPYSLLRETDRAHFCAGGDVETWRVNIASRHVGVASEAEDLSIEVIDTELLYVKAFDKFVRQYSDDTGNTDSEGNKIYEFKFDKLMSTENTSGLALDGQGPEEEQVLRARISQGFPGLSKDRYNILSDKECWEEFNKMRKVGLVEAQQATVFLYQYLQGKKSFKPFDRVASFGKTSAKGGAVKLPPQPAHGLVSIYKKNWAPSLASRFVALIEKKNTATASAINLGQIILAGEFGDERDALIQQLKTCWNTARDFCTTRITSQGAALTVNDLETSSDETFAFFKRKPKDSVQSVIQELSKKHGSISELDKENSVIPVFLSLADQGDPTTWSDEEGFFYIDKAVFDASMQAVKASNAFRYDFYYKIDDSSPIPVAQQYNVSIPITKGYLEYIDAYKPYFLAMQKFFRIYNQKKPNIFLLPFYNSLVNKSKAAIEKEIACLREYYIEGKEGAKEPLFVVGGLKVLLNYLKDSGRGDEILGPVLTSVVGSKLITSPMLKPLNDWTSGLSQDSITTDVKASINDLINYLKTLNKEWIFILGLSKYQDDLKSSADFSRFAKDKVRNILSKRLNAAARKAFNQACGGSSGAQTRYILESWAVDNKLSLSEVQKNITFVNNAFGANVNQIPSIVEYLRTLYLDGIVKPPSGEVLPAVHAKQIIIQALGQSYADPALEETDSEDFGSGGGSTDHSGGHHGGSHSGSSHSSSMVAQTNMQKLLRSKQDADFNQALAAFPDLNAPLTGGDYLVHSLFKSDPGIGLSKALELSLAKGMRCDHLTTTDGKSIIDVAIELEEQYKNNEDKRSKILEGLRVILKSLTQEQRQSLIINRQSIFKAIRSLASGVVRELVQVLKTNGMSNLALIKNDDGCDPLMILLEVMRFKSTMLPKHKEMLDSILTFYTLSDSSPDSDSNSLDFYVAALLNTVYQSLSAKASVENPDGFKLMTIWKIFQLLSDKGLFSVDLEAKNSFGQDYKRIVEVGLIQKVSTWRLSYAQPVVLAGGSSIAQAQDVAKPSSVGNYLSNGWVGESRVWKEFLSAFKRSPEEREFSLLKPEDMPAFAASSRQKADIVIAAIAKTPTIVGDKFAATIKAMKTSGIFLNENVDGSTRAHKLVAAAKRASKIRDLVELQDDLIQAIDSKGIPAYAILTFEELIANPALLKSGLLMADMAARATAAVADQTMTDDV